MIMIFHGGYRLLINADNLVRSSMYTRMDAEKKLPNKKREHFSFSPFLSVVFFSKNDHKTLHESELSEFRNLLHLRQYLKLYFKGFSVINK